MGVFEELKGEFGQMLLTLGILGALVLLFFLYNISIWLIVGLIALGGVGYWMYKEGRLW